MFPVILDPVRVLYSYLFPVCICPYSLCSLVLFAEAESEPNLILSRELRHVPYGNGTSGSTPWTAIEIRYEEYETKK